MSIDGVEPAFLNNGLSHASHAETQAGTQSPFNQPKVDQTQLPECVPDTHGLKRLYSRPALPGPRPRVVLTPDPSVANCAPLASTHPVRLGRDPHRHRSTPLKGVGMTFIAVMALGFANVGVKMPFCPLVVTVKPDTIEFEVAKSAAEYVKIDIINKADFDEIEVAIWESAMSFSGAGVLVLNPSSRPLTPCSTGRHRVPPAVRIHARHRPDTRDLSVCS